MSHYGAPSLTSTHTACPYTACYGASAPQQLRASGIPVPPVPYAEVNYNPPVNPGQSGVPTPKDLTPPPASPYEATVRSTVRSPTKAKAQPGAGIYVAEREFGPTIPGARHQYLVLIPAKPADLPIHEIRSLRNCSLQPLGALPTSSAGVVIGAHPVPDPSGRILLRPLCFEHADAAVVHNLFAAGMPANLTPVQLRKNQSVDTTIMALLRAADHYMEHEVTAPYDFSPVGLGRSTTAFVASILDAVVGPGAGQATRGSAELLAVARVPKEYFVPATRRRTPASP